MAFPTLKQTLHALDDAKLSQKQSVQPEPRAARFHMVGWFAAARLSYPGATSSYNHDDCWVWIVPDHKPERWTILD
jgi:hypothetical protein